LWAHIPTNLKHVVVRLLFRPVRRFTTIKHDCCVNGYMLFYDNDTRKKDALLLQCKFCHKLRYHPINAAGRKKKLISVKSMFYFPLI